MSDVTIGHLEEISEKYLKAREEAAIKKAEASEAQAVVDALEDQLIGILTETGKKSYQSNVGLITKVQKSRVNLPATPEAKAQLFAYLKERGHYDQLITVNSQTLNSYFNQELEAVKSGDNPEDAITFTLPGLEPPKVYETLQFRRKGN